MCKLKTVLGINVALFAVIGVVHLLRLGFQWDVQFDGWSVPLWLNALFLVLAGTIVWLNGKHLKK